MDWCQNRVSVAGNLHSNCSKLEELPEFGSKHGTLDDLFASHGSEGDMALEWLSTFVEDCLTSTGNSLPPPEVHPKNVQTTFSTKLAADKGSEGFLHSEKVQKTASFLHRIVIPGKARSKRKRASILKARTPFSCWSHQDQSFQLISSDPPLLQQAYWLADSELIKPRKDENNNTSEKQEQKAEEVAPRALKEVEDGRERLGSLEASSNGQLQPRRCSHCLAQKTPQWRAGPLGPKTLCNACGVRYKSGRLLPEYRPAKSPTFVSYKHSNSHKKVMEMRMALVPSDS